MIDVEERLKQAFVNLFAARKCGFLKDGKVDLKGGHGYFGVDVPFVAADASEVELVVTFRAGVRYCCYEAICHFAYSSERGWRKLRQHMDDQGLEHLPLPAIRKFRGVIEPGAVMQPGMVGNPEASFVNDGAEYEKGPWQPITVGRA